MYLMRIGERGAEIPVASDDGVAYVDARPVTADFDPDFFAGAGLAGLRSALSSG